MAIVIALLGFNNLEHIEILKYFNNKYCNKRFEGK